MSRLFYHVMQDNSGNLLFDVSGTMRLAGSGTLATIYGDEALTVILPNPMTNHPSYGSFKCFLGAGDYDFYMAKAGYTFETLTGVQGHGTMAQQNASAVAITGGNVTAGDIVGSRMGVNAAVGSDAVGTLRVGASAIVGGNVSAAGEMTANKLGLNASVTADAPGTLRVGADAVVGANLNVATAAGFGRSAEVNARLTVQVTKAGTYGMFFRQDADSGTALTMAFHNAAGGLVGSINSTGAATAFNTSSDVRQKHSVAPLTGALDVVRRLRPITHLWRADDSRGYGFVAHEVQDTLPADAGVVTGERDAVDEKGQIIPQQIDYGKLVPWLTAALNDALGALDTLTARVASLEQQLGV